MLIVLVFACLWYTGRWASSGTGMSEAGGVPLLNSKVYVALLGFALILAFLWH